MNKTMRELRDKNKIIDPNRPLISIVTVVYNGEKFLKDAIKSVINQCYENIEYIIIDGGSDDTTVDIIKQYESHVDYWVSEQDEGQSDAFTKGFARCSGEWVTWLNADDVLLPDSISLLIRSVRANPEVDCFMGNIIWADADGLVLLCRKGERWTPSLAHNGYLNTYGPTTFFKNELYKSVVGIDRSLHYCMDTDLWWQFFRAGARFMRLPNYTWMLRVHEDAKTTAQYFSDSGDQEKVIAQKNNESALICNRHHVFRTVKGRVLLFCHRVTSVRYLVSLIDSLRYKGVQYTRIKPNDS
tara:strand:- start:1478 stop:2374 length:897 start_codon:yes stop_codon:yes gene_type:complete